MTAYVVFEMTLWVVTCRILHCYCSFSASTSIIRYETFNWQVWVHNRPGCVCGKAGNLLHTGQVTKALTHRKVQGWFSLHWSRDTTCWNLLTLARASAPLRRKTTADRRLVDILSSSHLHTSFIRDDLSPDSECLSVPPLEPHPEANLPTIVICVWLRSRWKFGGRGSAQSWTWVTFNWPDLTRPTTAVRPIQTFCISAYHIRISPVYS